MNTYTVRELEIRDLYIAELRLQLNEKSAYIIKLEEENKQMKEHIREVITYCYHPKLDELLGEDDV